MSDKQWHVFYRTLGMTENNTPGWMRADYLAPSAEGALSQLLEAKHNIKHARVYPGATAYVVAVTYRTPSVEIRHRPHNGGTK